MSATATPVQMYPIEAWDLLYILSQKNDSVLGSELSKWRTNPEKALKLIMDKERINSNNYGLIEQCEWLRNPFPPADERSNEFWNFKKECWTFGELFVIKPDVFRNIITAEVQIVEGLEGYWKMALCKTITRLFAIL